MKTTEAGGERGYDGEKKVNGRKRKFWVDTNSFLLRVLVHAADISDTEGAEWLLSEPYHRFLRMTAIRVDQGRQAGLERRLAQHPSIQITVLEKPPEQKGFAVIPKRWVVERSIAWAGRKRQASREYNRDPESSEACISLGSATMLPNRLYPRK